MHVCISGVAGFIGHQLALRLLEQGYSVVGIDNINTDYDVNLKKARLSELTPYSNFYFEYGDLTDYAFLNSLFSKEKFTHVINLAAQTGANYININPRNYAQANLIGFTNILEVCRQYHIQHFIFASSGSVYGLNDTQPYSEHHSANHPMNFYAATKKANEVMAHSYSHLYGLACTGLRLFTTYGPWERSNTGLHFFTTSLLQNKPIKMPNNGHMWRDLIYIDDVVESIIHMMQNVPIADPLWNMAQPDPASSSAPWRICNIGINTLISLEELIFNLENVFNKKAIKEYIPLATGTMESTDADISNLVKYTGFSPTTSLEDGLTCFAIWYKTYYNL